MLWLAGDQILLEDSVDRLSCSVQDWRLSQKCDDSSFLGCVQFVVYTLLVKMYHWKM